MTAGHTGFAAHQVSFNEVVVNRRIAAFLADEDGAALAEYGILIAFIAVVAIMAVTFFGTRISTKFSAFATSLG